MLPLTALLAVALSAPAAPVPTVKPNANPPLLLSVGVHAVHGQRVLTPGGSFPVLLTNTSDKPVKVWREWCSWGYFNLSLVFRTRTAADSEERVVAKAARGWSKNYPDAAELAPGESMVLDVKLDPKVWKDLEFLDGQAGKKVTMRVRYVSAPDEDAHRQGVWTGTLETPFREYTVAK